MGKRTATNRREQTSKGREVSLKVRAVQGRRFSNAAGPHIRGERYSRAESRAALMRGDFDYFDSL